MKGKFIIYQMLLRVFGNANEHCIPGGSLQVNGSGHFDDITSEVLEGIKKLSVSYIWYTGVICHATSGDVAVKGKAGSPYAIKDYYDVNSYLSANPSKRMEEFSKMVERTHKAGMGVITDFVPNHVSRNYSSDTEPFTDDNYYSGRIYDGDWSDTAKLNYSNRDTWQKMLNILLFWASKGVDGFRCDMVELVPVEFWIWCIPQVKEKYPSLIFIAEVYQPHLYHDYANRGGFDYLYDKMGFYDTLRGVLSGSKPASSLTGEWQKIGDLQPKMLNFLENHDEQRIASDFFTGDPYKIMPALYTSLYFNTAPFLLYFGQEFGERGMDAEGFSGVDGRTSIYDYWSLSCIRHWISGIRNGHEESFLSSDEGGVLRIYRKILSKAVNDPLLRFGETYDLEYLNLSHESFNPDKHFAFLRLYENNIYLCAVNFSDSKNTLKIVIPTEFYPEGVIQINLERYSGFRLKIR